MEKVGFFGVANRKYPTPSFRPPFEATAPKHMNSSLASAIGLPILVEYSECMYKKCLPYLQYIKFPQNKSFAFPLDESKNNNQRKSSTVFYVLSDTSGSICPVSGCEAIPLNPQLGPVYIDPYQHYQPQSPRWSISSLHTLTLRRGKHLN